MHVLESHRLGKRYWLGDGGTYGTLGGTVASVFQRRPRRIRREELWALRDVSFSVEEGESVGIVGRNGAGKSTLLKILARITDPTEGRARTRGRVGALLEVGTAFHPELTGRENIAINGALLGMGRAEVRRRFDEIVAFSGVERFLDTPLKRYSSGMHLRLAFSVAAHFEPDIMVVDEVLATGDAEFQQRCMVKMSELGQEGRTVLFVSHDLGAIGRLCRRALWIDAGGVRMEGASHEVVDRYLRAAVAPGHRAVLPRDESRPVQLLELSLTTLTGSPVESLARGEPLAVNAVIDVPTRVAGLDAAFWIVSQDGTRIVDERLSDDPANTGRLTALGRHDVRLTLPALLAPGEYLVGAWLGTEDEDFFYSEALSVRVLPLSHDREELVQRKRAVAPEASWTVAVRA
jgi:ABC-type polysaccharide/polyol phosphate transport system ATPase subunit